jgi:adenosylcobinamide kinase/adenosylcobinamide-phosphate guanylyltransferase
VLAFLLTSQRVKVKQNGRRVTSPMLTLVLGGARSGKSRFAQSLCGAGHRVAFVATARLEDDEMRARAAHHRQERPKHWHTIEEPLAIARVVEANGGDFDFVLLDCLTLWLSNLCWEHRDGAEDVLRAAASDEVARLIAASSALNVVIVSNEVGYGLVPESSVGRVFRDLQGWLNQDLACAANYVYQVVAGIPIPIKHPEAKR